jgi:hypothetical protein
MKKSIFLLLFTILLKILVILNTDLSPDECYYFLWSKNLEISYYDHPPFVAYLIYISTKIFGENEFGVRFSSILLSFLTGIFLIMIGKKLKDYEISFNIILLISTSIIFSVGSFIITPDTPLIFFLILSYYFLLKYKENKNFIYLCAIFFGFSLLSKYTAILVLPSFIYFFYKEKILFKKEGILFFLISLFIFSPVLIWNFKNNFISFKFQLHHGLPSKKLNFLNTINYLRDTVLVLSFPLSLLIFYYSFKGILKEKLNFLTISAFLPFTFFLLTSLRFRPEANWPCISYIFMIILSGIYLKREKIFWAFFTISFIINIFLHIHAIHPIIKIKNDPILRIKGKREFTLEVDKIRKEKNIKNVAANTYQIASILSFYLPDRPFVPSLNISSRENQFSLWKNKFFNLNEEFIFIGKMNKKILEEFEKIEKIKRLNFDNEEIDVYILKK